MIVPYPTFAISASVAFTIVGKVFQLAPPAQNLTLRMTFPCGGQYQCLSILAVDGRTHVCDFNILSGRFHAFSPLGESDIAPAESWPEERNYLMAFLSSGYGIDRIVDDVLVGIGISKTETPDLYVGSMALVIGAVVGRFLFDREEVTIENGWANDTHWPDWLESAPEDCMLMKPFTDDVAGKLWRVQFGDRSVLFDDEIAYLTGTDEAFDVCTKIIADDGLTYNAATRIEEHLRGKTSLPLR